MRPKNAFCFPSYVPAWLVASKKSKNNSLPHPFRNPGGNRPGVCKDKMGNLSEVTHPWHLRLKIIDKKGSRIIFYHLMGTGQA